MFVNLVESDSDVFIFLLFILSSFQKDLPPLNSYYFRDVQLTLECTIEPGEFHAFNTCKSSLHCHMGGFSGCKYIVLIFLYAILSQMSN